MDTFAALADPTRRALLDLLTQGERPAGELAAAFPDLSQPAISRHLALLRKAGLVTVRPVAQQRRYALCPDGFAEFEGWLQKYRAFWPDRLDRLEAYLDATHQKG